VRVTIWLYHLDKGEIRHERAKQLDTIRQDLRKADIEHKLWAPRSPQPDLRAKNNFDTKIAEIRSEISDEAEFARAKRCAVRLAIADYPWIEEFIPIP